ncbi:glycosyltransferase [Planomonospora corallina]|uniref:Glycosyltransferase n=1 Tax=Planomonospora corallina TaxID=1806052 RepID=A0ABV8I0P9_9ACTN
MTAARPGPGRGGRPSPGTLVRHNDYSCLRPPALGDWSPHLTVSVVIPARDCQEALDRTLAALAAQSYPAHLMDVVVADDGSSPALRVPALAPANTRIVRVPEGRWGRGWARRTGSSAAEGEVVHWVDSDMVLDREHVEAHLRWHHLSPCVVVLGDVLFTPAGPEPGPADIFPAVGEGRAAGLFPSAAPHAYRADLLARTGWLREAGGGAFHLHTGATTSVSAALLRAAGGVDASLHMGEDTDLGYRLAQAGAVFVPDPQARSWHLGPSTVMLREKEVHRHNWSVLPDLIPDLRWLRSHPRRTWRVPYVDVVVDAAGASYEDVRASVDSVLAGTLPDAAVTLLGPWHEFTGERRSALDDPLLDLRLVRNLYGHEPRVSFAGELPPTSAPTPFRLRLPAGWALAPDALARMTELARREEYGLLGVALGEDAGGVLAARLERTAAFARAALAAGPDGAQDLDGLVHELWGSFWTDGEQSGVARAGKAGKAEPAPQTPKAPKPAQSGKATEPAKTAVAAPAAPAAQARPAAPSAGSPQTPQVLRAGPLAGLVRAALDRNAGDARRRVLVYLAGFEPTGTAGVPGTPVSSAPSVSSGPSRTAPVVDLDGDLSGAPDPGQSAAEVLLLARTPTDLRRAATLQSLLPAAERVVVAVAETPPAWTAPVLSPTPAHRWRALTDLRVHRPDGASWAVEARFGKPVPAGRTVAATARAFAGHRLDAVTAPVAGLAGPGAAHWRPGDPNAAPAASAGPVPERFGARGGDLVLRVTGSDPEPWAGAESPLERPVAELLSWERLGQPGGAAILGGDLADLSDPRSLPPVDDRSVNPMGFVTVPALGMAELRPEAGRWTVVCENGTLTRFASSGCVTDTDVHRIRRVRGIRVDWRRAHSGPLAALRVVAGLAAAGVPLVSGPVPPWAAALGAELVRLMTSVGEADLADDLRREEYSVRLRREALRTHGVRARWEQLGAPRPPAPATSVLLATRRPELARFALAQVGRQRGAELELVLALHGVPADHPEVKEALASFDRPVTVFEADSRTVFGQVLNEAAARASGSYLLKMDDDDWYGPDFLSDLLLAHSYSGAQVVGTVPEFVYLAPIDVTVHREQVTEQITNFIAGGTIFAERSAFEAVGGFRPLPRAIDAQFQHAVQAAGGQIYRTHGLGYILRRGKVTGHTWREPIGTFLRRNKRQWRGFRPNALMELPQGPDAPTEPVHGPDPLTEPPRRPDALTGPPEGTP